MSEAEKRGIPGVGRSRGASRVAALLFGSLVLVAGGGCATTPRDAIEYAAKDASCPPQQLTAVYRPDVNAVDYAASFLGGPAPDVAANPERLAYWRKTETETWRGLMSGRRVFEVRGCGMHTLLACRTEGDGEVTQVACSWLDRPLAIQRGQLVD